MVLPPKRGFVCQRHTSTESMNISRSAHKLLQLFLNKKKNISFFLLAFLVCVCFSSLLHICLQSNRLNLYKHKVYVAFVHESKLYGLF